MTSNNILNEKLKSLNLKKIFVLNNIEYLFKEEDAYGWHKIIKNILDFFEVSSKTVKRPSRTPKHQNSLKGQREGTRAV